MAKTLIETRRRGVVGWVFLVQFWLWNVAMAIASYMTFAAAPSATTPGALVGEALAITMMAVVWACGAVVLGLMVILTRGKRVLIERE